MASHASTKICEMEANRAGCSSAIESTGARRARLSRRALREARSVAAYSILEEEAPLQGEDDRGRMQGI